jgi:hypothetical protein
MWSQWFVRCSTSIKKWPLRFVCDECKRHRFILSFSPLLFINNRKLDNISLYKYNRQKNEKDEQKHDRNDYKRHSTLLASSIVGVLTSASAMFSWENDGISNEEL